MKRTAEHQSHLLVNSFGETEKLRKKDVKETSQKRSIRQQKTGLSASGSSSKLSMLRPDENGPQSETVTIPLRLTSLNEYINAERTNRYAAAGIKKKNQRDIEVFLREAINTGKLHHHENAALEMIWTVPNKRRDLDNVAFATKFIQDALVEIGVFDDDNLDHITELHHYAVIEKGVFSLELKIIENDRN